MYGVKKVFSGIALFGLGAIAGYFTGKKLLEKQFRKDVNELQDFYRAKLDEIGVMPEGFEYPDTNGDDDGDDEDDDDAVDAMEEYYTDGFDKQDAEEAKRRLAVYKGERRRCAVEYNKPSLLEMKRALRDGASVIVDVNGEENLGNIDDEDEDPEYMPSNDPQYEAELEKMAEEYALRRSENMQKGEPYLIEPEEYHEGPEEYDRQALYYYANDRTLCEDDDAQVEDEEACVGFDYEDKLDMQTTCWVRNDQLRVLYEIHRIDESYKSAVLGLSETPREREFRIQGRRKKGLDDNFKG